MITSLRKDDVYNIIEYRGLSTDEKPVNTLIGNGSVFIEMDTSKIFFFNKENQTWLEFR